MINFIKQTLKERLIAKHQCSECNKKFAPKIQKGFVYRNGKGNYILIEELNPKGFPVGSDGWCYEWNGLLGGGYFEDDCTLDASKPYRLVEVKNE